MELKNITDIINTVKKTFSDSPMRTGLLALIGIVSVAVYFDRIYPSWKENPLILVGIIISSIVLGLILLALTNFGPFLKYLGLILLIFVLGVAIFLAFHFIRDSLNPNAIKKVKVNGQIWTAENIRNPSIDDTQCLADGYGCYYTYEGAYDACAKLGIGWTLPSVLDWQKTNSSKLRLNAGGFGKYNHVDDWGIQDRGVLGYYWTSTKPAGTNYPKYIMFNPNTKEILEDEGSTGYQYNCRCIKK
ncbi:MAG: hypothetical protein AAF502_25265 [Bacteroidota bacterium]